MRKHYDFSKAKRNPYAQRLKRQVTIRLDRDPLSAAQERELSRRIAEHRANPKQEKPGK